MAVHSDPPETAPSDNDREALVEIARQIAGRDVPGAPPDAPAPRNPPAPAPDAALPASALLARLIDTLPVAAALCRGDRLVRANRDFARAFGYRSGEDMAAEGGLARALPDLAATLAAPSGMTASVRPMHEARARDGTAFTLPLSIARISPEGPLSLIVLDAAQAARTPASAPGARESRSDFLAKVSHEVRTPLASIIGFAEMMKEERFGPIDNPKYREYVRDIHDSGIYALSLINDLLDITKIEAGKFEMNFTAVDANDVIADAVHIMQPQARAARVVLRAALAEHLPMLLADRRSLKQILLNLLSNAVKFTAAGGQAIVSTQADADGGVRVRVRDTGVGMSASDIAQALEPFRQLDTAPRQQAGTGLGLPLTRALVIANRARFAIDSTAGLGTSVDVIFPRDRVVG